jgi:hypothetical protein
MNTEAPRVLYISGDGRSGSTLLSALLGANEGFFPVGELRGIWHAVRTNELCGCGTPFLDCSFWRVVGERVFAGWDRVDTDRMLALDARYARHRSIGRLFVPAIGRNRDSQREQYAAVLRRLYEAVWEESGCSVIVDSSKDAPYGFLLSGIEGLDVRVVHLVRDSRGVAYSWSKRTVARPEYVAHPTLQRTFMNWQSPVRSALEWDLKNVLCHALSRSAAAGVFLRYETLVQKPDWSLAEIRRGLRWDAPVNSPPVSLAASGEFESLPHHTLGGNRVRFARGVVQVRGDDEWKTKMRRTSRLQVGILTLPLLIAYGYIGHRRGV